jgi:hypothetical protein
MTLSPGCVGVWISGEGGRVQKGQGVSQDKGTPYNATLTPKNQRLRTRQPFFLPYNSMQAPCFQRLQTRRDGIAEGAGSIAARPTLPGTRTVVRRAGWHKASCLTGERRGVYTAKNVGPPWYRHPTALPQTMVFSSAAGRMCQRLDGRCGAVFACKNGRNSAPRGRVRPRVRDRFFLHVWHVW